MALLGQWTNQNLIETFVSHQSPVDNARFIRERLPSQGLFGGLEFRIAPTPFSLDTQFVKELEFLGRILLRFNAAANLLYRLSAAGKQPKWIAEWLDIGKPPELIERQRSLVFKNEVPRIIRPDILLTENGAAITELDSVPGGIGLTAWLNQSYFELDRLDRTNHSAAASTPVNQPDAEPSLHTKIVGGEDAILRGFEKIFDAAERVHVVVSEEASTYRPEMEWLCDQLGTDRFSVRDSNFSDFKPGDAVYRFFELFDLSNVSNSLEIFDLAGKKKILLTPPAKPLFEEKMLFALLWNRNLRGFWHQELGKRFYERLLELIPYTWLMDPTPMPPHAGIPELNLTDWGQLKTLSQKERNLILKVSGFSESAWGARGVYLGSDLSGGDWSAAVDLALRSFDTTPFVLQRFQKPKVVDAQWVDLDRNELVPMKGRVRLCPYFFCTGEGDAARSELGGVLATVCPADKKIIHGMRDAILSPCSVRNPLPSAR